MPSAMEDGSSQRMMAEFPIFPNMGYRKELNCLGRGYPRTRLRVQPWGGKNFLH
jgi:hypothetical protein